MAQRLWETDELMSPCDSDEWQRPQATGDECRRYFLGRDLKDLLAPVLQFVVDVSIFGHLLTSVLDYFWVIFRGVSALSCSIVNAIL